MSRSKFEVYSRNRKAKVEGGVVPVTTWRWRLRAKNGEVVCGSEGYTRKEDAIRGAKDAKRAALFAGIDEV